MKNAFFIALLLSVCVMSVGCGRHAITLRVLDPETNQNGRNWLAARELVYSVLIEHNPLQRVIFFEEAFRTLGYVSII